MRVLITGATGQLGTELCRVFSAETVFPFDLPEFDFADPNLAERIVREQPDLIVHAGAFTDVDGAEREPARASAINATGTERVAIAAQRCGARLFYISTDYVFPGTKMTPYEETDSPAPLNVYGRSKWEGEQAVHRSGVRSLIIRTAWLYGQHGKNFVKSIMHAVRTQAALQVVADQRGCPTYAEDLAVAIRSLADRQVEGILHVTNRGDCTWHEFACAIVAEMGRPIPVHPITTQMAGRLALRPAYSVLAQDRVRSLGLILPDWRDALTRFMHSQQGAMVAP
ncbi:MAG: dTDP-4-dehydrorhamnose reductase [Nitrospira sp.]